VAGGAGVASVVAGGGVTAASLVVVTVAAGAGGSALGACALGSWVESVVTSVTGGTAALGTVGCGVVEIAVELGATAATVFGALVGVAIFGFLGRRRRVVLAAPAATGAAEETVTGCELDRVMTGSACVTGSAALAAKA